jgi:hypothetical protein
VAVVVVVVREDAALVQARRPEILRRLAVAPQEPVDGEHALAARVPQRPVQIPPVEVDELALLEILHPIHDCARFFASANSRSCWFQDSSTAVKMLQVATISWMHR